MSVIHEETASIEENAKTGDYSRNGTIQTTRGQHVRIVWEQCQSTVSDGKVLSRRVSAQLEVTSCRSMPSLSVSAESGINGTGSRASLGTCRIDDREEMLDICELVELGEEYRVRLVEAAKIPVELRSRFHV